MWTCRVSSRCAQPDQAACPVPASMRCRMASSTTPGWAASVSLILRASCISSRRRPRSAAVATLSPATLANWLPRLPPTPATSPRSCAASSRARARQGNSGDPTNCRATKGLPTRSEMLSISAASDCEVAQICACWLSPRFMFASFPATMARWRSFIAGAENIEAGSAASCAPGPWHPNAGSRLIASGGRRDDPRSGRVHPAAPCFNAARKPAPAPESDARSAPAPVPASAAR